MPHTCSPCECRGQCPRQSVRPTVLATASGASFQQRHPPRRDRTVASIPPQRPIPPMAQSNDDRRLSPRVGVDHPKDLRATQRFRSRIAPAHRHRPTMKRAKSPRLHRASKLRNDAKESRQRVLQSRSTVRTWSVRQAAVPPLPNAPCRVSPSTHAQNGALRRVPKSPLPRYRVHPSTRFADQRVPSLH